MRSSCQWEAWINTVPMESSGIFIHRMFLFFNCQNGESWETIKQNKIKSDRYFFFQNIFSSLFCKNGNCFQTFSALLHSKVCSWNKVRPISILNSKINPSTTILFFLNSDIIICLSNSQLRPHVSTQICSPLSLWPISKKTGIESVEWHGHHGNRIFPTSRRFCCRGWRHNSLCYTTRLMPEGIWARRGQKWPTRKHRLFHFGYEDTSVCRFWSKSSLASWGSAPVFTFILCLFPN